MISRLIVPLSIVLGVVLQFTLAVDVQATVWKTPDGTVKDLALTFTNGQTIPLVWNNWTSTQYLDTTKSKVYLWVTSFDYDQNKYAEILKKDIDLTYSKEPGTFPWTINIPSKYLHVSAKYVLRFKPPGTTFNISTGQIASPGFLVLAQESTTTAKSTSTPPSTTKPNPTTGPKTPNPSPKPSSKKSDLPTGAKAGIAVGVVVGAIAIAGLLGFIIIRRRRGQMLAYEENVSYDQKIVPGPIPHSNYPPPAWVPVEPANSTNVAPPAHAAPTAPVELPAK